MGIDPISLGLTLLAVYAMLKRSPQWAGEMAEEWRAAKQGEESPAATARRKRLIDAGIDPATGGAMRQYMGNRWREYWLDADQKAKARRAARMGEADGESVKSWRDRLAERADDQIEQRVAAWRSRPESDRRLYDTTGATEGIPDSPPTPAPTGTTTGGGNRRQPPPPSSNHDPGDEEPITVIHDSDEYLTDTDHNRRHADGHIPHQRQDPIRVDVTVGAPIREPNQHNPAAPAAITAGGTMSNALAPQAVTGVTSGAAEARAIQRALDAANAAYVTALTQVRNRIQALGEQTVGNVQMAVHSRVVGHTAAAAEAAAAAQAAARSCGAEVGPLLGQVAREFDRISS